MPSSRFPHLLLFLGALCACSGDSAPAGEQVAGPDPGSHLGSHPGELDTVAASRAALERGLAAAGASDAQGALEAYREAVALDDGNAEAHHLLGRALIALARVGAGRGGQAPGRDGGVMLGNDVEQQREAIEHLERAVALEPENVDHLYWMGRGKHVADDTDGALAAFRQLLELAPDHGPTHKRVGLIHLDRGEPELARRAFEEAERFLPRDPGVPFQLGNVLAEDDPRAAVEAYRRSVAIDPTFASSYNGMIGPLTRLGDRAGAEQARAAFERWRYFEIQVRAAVSRANESRDDPALQLAAGELYLVKQDWEQALQFFQRGLLLDTTDPQAHFYNGLVARELGLLDAARDHLEETVYLQPTALEPRLELLHLVAEQGDDERYEQLFAELEAAAESLDVEGRVQYARTLLDVGRLDAAAVQFRAVLAEVPDDQRALDGLEAAEGPVEDSLGGDQG